MKKFGELHALKRKVSFGDNFNPLDCKLYFEFYLLKLYFKTKLFSSIFPDEIHTNKKTAHKDIRLFKDNSDDGKSGFNTIIQLETGGRLHVHSDII